jgi:hypothetical protein
MLNLSIVAWWRSITDCVSGTSCDEPQLVMLAEDVAELRPSDDIGMSWEIECGREMLSSPDGIEDGQLGEFGEFTLLM